MIFTWRVLTGLLFSSFLLTASAKAQFDKDFEAVLDRIFARKNRPAQSLPAKVTVPPIQVPSGNHRLTAQLLQQHVQWLADHIIETVSKRHAAEPWLPDARAFVGEAARFFNWQATMNPMTGAYAKPSQTLLQTAARLGPLDPLLLLTQANLETLSRSMPPERLESLAAKLPALLSDNNHPVLKLMAAAWLWHATEDGTIPNPVKQVRQKCMDQLPALFVASLNAAQKPQDAEAVYQTIRYSQGSRFLETHSQEMTPTLAKAAGPDWLRETLLGLSEVHSAWEGRGGLWAANVSEKGWKTFDDHMNPAREHLVKAWQANPAVPWAATMMITATMAGYGEKGSDERVWFDRAIAAVFDFEDAYDHLIWAYRPRWGGSHEQMLAFGAACAATARYDTRVPSRLFSIIKDVASEMPDRNDVHQNPEVCRQIVKLQQAMLQNAKSESETHYYRSFLVANAFLARDYATAHEHFKLLNKPMHWEASERLKNFGQPYFLWSGVLEAHDVPEAFTTLQKAEDAYREFRLPEARSLFQELVKSPTLAERKQTLRLVRLRLASIAVENRLAKGDWVRLADNERKQLWQPDWGSWWNHEEGDLSFRADTEGLLGRVIMNARIGREFEVRAKLANPAELTHPQFGAVLGFFWGSGTYATAVCGQTAPDPRSKGAALVERAHDVRDDQQPFPATIKPDSTIRLQVTKDTLTLWVDDQKVLDAVSIPSVLSFPSQWTQADPRRCLFGFGANYFPKGESWIKGIEFRRLDVQK